MLQKLNNQQVSEHWAEIKPAILSSLPDNRLTPEAWEVSFLSSLERDTAAVWVELDLHEKISAIVTTLVVWDQHAFGKHLLIYSVFAYIPNALSQWEEISKVLEEYARDLGCVVIAAITANKRVIEVARSLGWEISAYIQRRL